MAGVLYNRGKQSRYQGNFKNELQECLSWIETLREMDCPYDVNGDQIYLAGNISLDSVNRLRRSCGLRELEPACGACKAATLGACICDPLNDAQA